MTPRWTLVVNPAAGRGRARRLLPRIVDALRAGRPGVDLEVVASTSATDAEDACRVAVGTRDALVVVGGDGMTSLGLNAAAGSGVPLGIVPAGTGNDFCRGVGLPTRWREAVDVVLAGHVDHLDLMGVTGNLADARSERFVGSIVSTGFDERVNHRTNQLPVTVGALSYAWSTLAELRSFRPLRYRIELDDVPRELDAMLVAVGNAGVFGGGMRGCPDADVRDGLLDVTIIHPVGRGTLLRLLPRLFDGSFVRHPAVELARAQRVRVDGDGLWAMADGEDLGRVPLLCRAVPGALALFVPGPGAATG